MQSNESVDLAVVGGGSAGVRLSRFAAGLGAKVAVFERGAFGGTCVNLGCIPKKLLAYGAHAAHEIAEARAMGWSLGDATLDWPTLLALKDREIARLNAVYEKLLTDAGVRVVRGHAEVGRDGEALVVRCEGRATAARHVVIATGARPRRPAIAGAELGDVSDDFFHWPTLPRSIVVVGGGYVALEIASVLCALGVEVDVLTRGSLLSGFDPDLRTFLAGELVKRGMRLHESAGDVRSVERDGDRLAVTSERGPRLVGHRVLFAIGRDPIVDGLGLEALGVRVERGAVIVDERYATSVPGVYAIGDVTAHMELTPVALAEGMLLARSLFGAGGPPIRYDLVPTAVFSMPPVASVGLSEPTAKARGADVRIFQTDFRPLKNVITGSETRTRMKVVVDAATDRVLGIHVVGTDAPEIIQGFAAALVAGITKAQLDATIGVHPTSAEELVTLRTALR